MKYRLKNGLLLLFNGEEFLIKKEDLFIKDSHIEAIGEANIADADEYTVYDASGQLIMPGLINSHTHVYMNFMKNSADDIPFGEWLFDRIFPVEAKMQKDDFYWTTLLGCIEMIKTGTTCFLDMHICENECAKAVRDSGMRGFMGRCITGTDLYTDGYDNFKNAIAEKEEYESELLKFVLSPHSVYACSGKMLSQINEEATKRNMLKHIHLSESDKELSDALEQYGKTPVEYLREIGFLDSRTMAAHCVKLNERDMDILSSEGVNVATNPSSNAKLGNGIAPVPSMMKKGINVCLGTDSAASNNTLNMFREMGIFSLLHKATEKSSVVLSAAEVLKTATVNPAAALGMAGMTGVISEGALADLIFIDMNSPSLFPGNDIVSSLCYSANGSEVVSVMTGGKFLMKNRILTSVDTERVYYEAKRIADKYLK
ncbi:MAG: amidohydrolase [Clostridia bacterium]|nr:amidohydrolase [Clostridia bacterium]